MSTSRTSQASKQKKRSSTARFRVGGAITLTVTLLTAGCTSSNSSSTTKSGAPAQATNRTITIAGPTLAPQTPDPDLAEASSQPIKFAVGDGLVQPDSSGKSSPSLATSWDVSADKLTWTFRLRQGVKMQDNSPFTADDVKTAIDRISDDPIWAFYASFKANLASVQVVDAHTVKVSTKTPDGSLPDELPPPVATAYYNRIGEKAFENHPIAAGVFKFVSQVLNSSMTFEVFKGFWDPSEIPNFSRLVFKVIPDESTRLAAVQSGQVDLASFSPQSASQLKAASNLTVVTSSAANQASIFFPDNYTGKDSPLRDARVRQALLMAIDRGTIVKALYSGFATVPVSWLFPIATGYDPNVKPYPYDPTQAKKVLEEAGATNLSITLHSYNASTGVPMVGALLQAVVSYWKAIGVKVTLDSMDPATYLPKLGAHAFDGAEIAGDPASLFKDPYQLQTFYGSAGQYSTVKDPALDALLNAVRAATDPTVRAAQAKKLDAYLYSHVYGFPIMNTDGIFAYGQHVAKFTPMAGDPFGSLWNDIVAR